MGSTKMMPIFSINKRLQFSLWLFVSCLFYSEMGLTVSENTVLNDSIQSSDKNSLKDLIKAAEQGDAAAQFKLGFRYVDGQGVPQDYNKARECYSKTAAQGYPPPKKFLKK